MLNIMLESELKCIFNFSCKHEKVQTLIQKSCYVFKIEKGIVYFGDLQRMNIGFTSFSFGNFDAFCL